MSHHTDFDIDVDELSEDDPRAPNPHGINVTLKPHQQTLLARCIEYENSRVKLKQFNQLSHHVDEQDYFQTSVGILGDRVGSGKSYVLLSLLTTNDITNRNDVHIKSHGFSKVVYYIQNKSTSIATNLLVVPHNLAVQWEYYIKTFGGIKKYKIIKTQKALDALLSEARNTTYGEGSDTDDDGHVIEEDEDNTYISFNVASVVVPQVKTPADVLGEYNLLVITSTLYNKLAHFLNMNKIKVQRAIYDEVDSLNVPGCKEVQANFYWFVTASYGNVIYPRGLHKYEPNVGRYIWYASGIKHSGFLKNILLDLFYNLSLNLIKVLVIKNKESYVEASLCLPEMISHYIQCKTPFAINVLNGIVDRNILNYLNADDIQGALQYINPTHKASEDNIVARVIDKYMRQITNINLQINTAREYLYDTENERQDVIGRLEKQLEQVQAKIDAITERIKNNNLCTICYDTADNKTVTSCCQNTFCFKCINLWLAQRKVCPMCKITLDNSGLYVVSDNSIEIEDNLHDNEPSMDMTKPNPSNDKYQNLELILSNMKSDAKFLIFSAYENSFNNIIPVLYKLNIKFDFLKGNGYQIQAAMERYKRSDVNVLLVNTRQYGSGLNLENTTDIVLFHKFDTEIEKQVIGRAQRLGRTCPLNIHYLLYENEMPTEESTNSVS